MLFRFKNITDGCRIDCDGYFNTDKIVNVMPFLAKDEQGFPLMIEFEDNDIVVFYFRSKSHRDDAFNGLCEVMKKVDI